MKSLNAKNEERAKKVLLGLRFIAELLGAEDKTNVDRSNWVNLKES